MGRYKVYLDLGDGAGYQDVTNAGYVKEVKPATISRDKNEMYIRIQIGEITFQNVRGEDFYSMIEGVDFLTEMRVKIEYQGLEIEGYFSRVDCSYDFDLNAKVIKAKPSIHDNYRYFLENYDTEVDLKDVEWNYETVTAKKISSGLKTVEYWDTESFFATKTLKDKEWDEYNTPGHIDFADFFLAGGAPNLTLLATPPTDARDPDSLTLQDVIGIMTGETKRYELSEMTIWRGNTWLTYNRWGIPQVVTWFNVTCKFSREEQFVPTSDGTITGDIVLPIGDGWGTEPISPIPKISSINGGTWGYVFARPPFNGAYANTWSLQDPESNTTDAGSTGFYWTVKRTTKIDYPSSEEDNGEFTIQGAIGLKDFLTTIYRGTSPELATKEVKSLFFFNDGEADFDFMDGRAGSNYVTNLPNELNNLKTFRTYILKTETDEDSKDDEFKLSFKKVLEDLQKLFPIKYHIDSNLDLWLEHVKFYELQKQPVGIASRRELINTYQYQFDTSDLFGEKIYNQKNSGYKDFSKNVVLFDQSVSNKRNKDTGMEITTEIFSTDLQYCLENPNNLEDGLVLVLAKDGTITNEIGQISGTEQVNGALSLSQLLRKYWTYEGVWFTGKINGQPTEFVNTVRSKTGIELKYSKIEPSLFYLTQIGVGLIDDGSLDFDSEITTIKLRYRYTSSELGEQRSYLVTKLNSLYDFDNTNDAAMPSGALSAYNFLIFGDTVFTGDEVFDWTI